MAYTTIDDPSAYFQTKLYTGNDSSRAITFDGNTNMQPDWCWFKARSEAYNHAAFDSVRGTTKLIRPNQNNAEETHSTTLTAFGSNGFSLGGGDAFTNADTVTYASWNWKAGTSFTNDASATGIGTIDSSGSVSTTAGFSIISWTGSGSGATIAHGLGAQPQIVFVKNRSDTASWNVYTVIGGGGKGLFLNDNAAFDSDSSYFNNGTASTTTFPVGSANTANGSSDNMIAYCFANVKGYSRISSFVGNGNADGTFVYLGFKPAFIIYKNTTNAREWILLDNKRLGYNPSNYSLFPNNTDTGSDGSAVSADLLSNGFKLRTTSEHDNESGNTFIYMAFAENPFVTSTGVPACAR